MDCFELLDQILLQPHLQGRPHLQRGGTKEEKPQSALHFTFYSRTSHPRQLCCIIIVQFLFSG